VSEGREGQFAVQPAARITSFQMPATRSR
jgi:hypothetical protein